MKKSLKGALLSGLLFPGAGQLWLKHPIRGIALMVAVSISLAVIVTKVGQQALSILEKMESEGGPVDLVVIANLAHASSYDDFAMKCACLALIVFWMVGIIDAYILGGKEEPAEQERSGPGKTP